MPNRTGASQVWEDAGLDPDGTPVTLASIHSCTAFAASTYSSDGVFVISCPGTYVAQMRSRRCFGSQNQCERHPHMRGGTATGQPGQWQWCEELVGVFMTRLRLR